MENIEIIEVSQVSDEFMESVARLLPQLTQKPVPSKEDLAEILTSPNTIVITACRERHIVGMLTLVLYRSPSALRARIEDVVVDQPFRGQGIGRAIIGHAMGLAARKKATTIDLTSNPTRKTANKLYESIGFKKHDTNIYRYRPT